MSSVSATLSFSSDELQGPFSEKESCRREQQDITYKGVTWYSSTRNCKYEIKDSSNNEYCELYLYCGKSDKGGIPLRIEAKYSGKDWLFIKKIQLKVIDGIDISFDLRRQSEVKSGTVLEWGDAHVSAKEAVELRKLIQSNKIYIRLWGKYSCDWEMTKEQRINFKEILDIYDYLVSESK